jgi:hypothetical protein
MARGWESKSVEAQQADALAEPQRSRSTLTPDQAQLRRKIEGLSLSRLRVLQELEASRDPPKCFSVPWPISTGNFTTCKATDSVTLSPAPKLKPRRLVLRKSRAGGQFPPTV